jgi:hypothetical protein
MKEVCIWIVVSCTSAPYIIACDCRRFVRNFRNPLKRYKLYIVIACKNTLCQNSEDKLCLNESFLFLEDLLHYKFSTLHIKLLCCLYRSGFRTADICSRKPKRTEIGRSPLKKMFAPSFTTSFLFIPLPTRRLRILLNPCSQYCQY